MTMTCPHCGQTVDTGDATARFCPLCGQALATQPAQPSDLERRLTAEKKPKKKYAMIQAELAKNPDDFAANAALLFHGRLHEPMKGRALDFSIIKCHLLCVFHEPDQYPKDVLDDKYEELLRGAQLRRTMALAPDADAFFGAYIRRLAFEYIDLFIRGDSRYSNVAFGIGRTPESLARKCADPVRAMLAEIAQTGRLTEAERALLLASLREGYAQVFPGFARFIENQDGRD